MRMNEKQMKCPSPYTKYALKDKEVSNMWWFQRANWENKSYKKLWILYNKVTQYIYIYIWLYFSSIIKVVLWPKLGT